MKTRDSPKLKRRSREEVFCNISPADTSEALTRNLNMAPVAAVSSGTHMDVSKIPNNAHPKWWKDPGMRKLAGAMAMG